MRILLFLLGFLSLALPASETHRPLNTLRLDVWTVDRGLPHNTVLGLAQTPDGYIWIGTWEGLLRFDGAHFAPLPVSAPAPLRDTGILALATARDGSLWIGTYGGGIYRLQQGRYTEFSRPGVDRNDRILTLLASQQGAVYAGTSSGQVLIRSGAQFLPLPHVAPSVAQNVYGLAEDGNGKVVAAIDSDLYELVDGGLQALAADWSGPTARITQLRGQRTGGFWLTTSRGLLRLDAQLARIQDTSFSRPVTRVFEDDDDTLWLGADPLGLVRITADDTSILGRASGLPNPRIAALLRDHERNLWVGSNGGLVRVSAAPFSAISERQGLKDPFVRTLLQRADGRVIIGSPGGLDQVGVDGSLDLAPDWPAALQQISVLALAESADGQLLVGSNAHGAMEWGAAGLVRRTAPEQLWSNQVRSILADSDGGVWYGTIQGLSHCRKRACQRFDASAGIVGDYITAISRDPQGVLWIGSATGVTRRSQEVFAPVPMADGLKHSVFGFLHDRQGRHWVATDAGLGLLRNHHIELVDRRHGLLENAVFSVLEDRAGQLWLSGNRGLLRIDPQQAIAVFDGQDQRLQGRHFARADGMPSSQANGGSQAAAIRGLDGRMWFATAGGVAIVDPADPSIDSLPPRPRVAIESLLIDGAEVDPQQGATLLADQRRLQIRFVGISFAAPERLKLRYRLQGFDTAWQPANQERSAHYTNLAPGQYRFELEAGWADAPSAGERVELDVRVVPAWHQRWPVRVMLVVAIAALLAMLYWLRVRTLRWRARYLEEEVARKTIDLVAERDALEKANQRNTELVQQLGLQARSDPLTGLANRRRADHELQAALEAGNPLTLALLDIDHFKTINDSHGHAVGDRVLQHFADALRQTVRSATLIARVGGEEFMVLWSGHDAENPVSELAALRQCLIDHDWQAIAPGLRVRFSAGLVRPEHGEDSALCTQRADAALYRAKRAGRDQTAWAG